MHLDGHQPHILVMDDSPELLALFRELLEEEGYTVSTRVHVSNDLDEIAALEPNLIILDHMWICGDDGWMLIQMLRKDARTEAIPVILCTGAARRMLEPLSARLVEMDIQVVLKPFDIEELLQVVASSTGRRHPPSATLPPYLPFASL